MKKVFILWIGILIAGVIIGCDMFTRDVYDLLGDWELYGKIYESELYTNGDKDYSYGGVTTNYYNKTNGTFVITLQELGVSMVTYYSNNEVTKTVDAGWAADEIKDHLTILGEDTNTTYVYSWTPAYMLITERILRTDSTNIKVLPVTLSNFMSNVGGVSNDYYFYENAWLFYKSGYTNTNISTNSGGGLPF